MKLTFINFQKNQTGGKASGDSKRYAVFSAVSYEKTNKARRAFLDKYNKKGWIIDKTLTNTNITVLRHEKTNKTIISIKGTNPKSLSDLGEDALIFTGTARLGPRARQVKKLYDKVVKKYGKNTITITGHSLGGYHAALLSSKTGVPAVVINKGSSPAQSLVERLLNKLPKLTRHYTTNVKKSWKSMFDTVSYWAAHVEKHPTESVKLRGKDHPHLKSHFLPEPNKSVGEGRGIRITCCGKSILKSSLKSHMKTKKHMKNKN